MDSAATPTPARTLTTLPSRLALGRLRPALVAEVTPTWDDIPTMPWKTSPTNGHMMGTVTIAGTGAWADGATVSITGPASRTQTNDGTGFYAFIDLPTGSYTVTASKSGYPNATGTVAVAVGAGHRQHVRAEPGLGGVSPPSITDPAAEPELSQGANATFTVTATGTRRSPTNGGCMPPTSPARPLELHPEQCAAGRCRTVLGGRHQHRRQRHQLQRHPDRGDDRHPAGDHRPSRKPDGHCRAKRDLHRHRHRHRAAQLSMAVQCGADCRRDRQRLHPHQRPAHGCRLLLGRRHQHRRLHQQRRRRAHSQLLAHRHRQARRHGQQEPGPGQLRGQCRRDPHRHRQHRLRLHRLVRRRHRHRQPALGHDDHQQDDHRELCQHRDGDRHR